MADGWYIKTARSELGPISLPRLRLLLQDGDIGDSDFVRFGADGTWHPVTSIDEFSLNVRPADEHCRWFCRIRDAEYGPLTSEELKSLAERTKIGSDIFVRAGDHGTWIRDPSFETLFADEISRDVAPRAAARRSAIMTAGQHTGTTASPAGSHLSKTGKSDSPVPARLDRTAWPGRLAGSSMSSLRSFARQCRDRASEYRVLLAFLAVWAAANAALLGLSGGGASLAAGPSFPPEYVDGEFREAYDTYVSVWYDVKRLRARGATADEWNRFAQETRSSLRPMLDRLRDSGNPAKVYLFRTGDSLVLGLLSNRGAEPDHLESLLEKHLRVARRALDAAGAGSGGRE